MFRYFANIRPGKIVLWCYLIWYLATVFFYFDPHIHIWLNSAGISAVIGLALMLSVATPAGARQDHWQTFRLFAMPFCVSSFSSLIKDQGFILIVPPRAHEQFVAVTACVVFVLLVLAIKRVFRARHRAIGD